jgi:hypothetical protein
MRKALSIIGSGDLIFESWNTDWMFLAMRESPRITEPRGVNLTVLSLGATKGSRAIVKGRLGDIGVWQIDSQRESEF